MVIILKSDTAALELRWDATGWCRVALKIRGRTRALGADSKEAVFQKLLAGFAEPVSAKPADEIEASPVISILSLYEGHVTLYSTIDPDGDRTLFFEDADGQLFDRFQYTLEDRQRWISQIQGASS